MGREETGGAAKRACSGVGSADKDLIHRTAHYPAGRGQAEGMAGHQSALQDQILAQLTSSNQPLSSHIPSVGARFFHEAWNFIMLG